MLQDDAFWRRGGRKDNINYDYLDLPNVNICFTVASPTARG